MAFPAHSAARHHIVPRGKNCLTLRGKQFRGMTAMTVPLVPQDLSAAETYMQISASLLALQRASEGVFDRMRDIIMERTGVCHS